MDHEIKYGKKNLCANCGKTGHEYRFCNEPITSFGIINIKFLCDDNESLILKEKFSTQKNTVVRVISKKYQNVKCYISNNIKLCDNHNEMYKLDNEGITYDNEEHIKKFCYYKDKILFMLVSRRFSLGFVEFVRGKYDLYNPDSIIKLFEQMTEWEISFISKNSYDDILFYFLNRNNESKDVVLNKIYEGRFSSEYCEAKIKFEILSNPNNNDEIPWLLSFYTKYIKPKWNMPEWGFPKGRREKKSEENLPCACREFEEETGYNNNEYLVLNKIEPIEEKLRGTNGVNYKHIYYLALNATERENMTDYDTYEIGDIKWLTYDDAMSHIRPYHHDKRKILTRIYLFLLNYLIHNNQYI